jgi:circadian clock protein KaiC
VKSGLDHVEFEEIGNYNLDGLFIQLEHLIKQLHAKRIVIDTLEVLFNNLNDQTIVRSELQRLFNWLKEKKVTAVITAEKGENLLTRNGLEEYVADCVILLDNRIENQVSTRRLRIIKYRGSSHGANEYPFLISNTGILVLPITSLNLLYQASSERISSGIKTFDEMLDGKGFYRGSSILISGTAGAGKSSFAACFANSVCQNGEKCLYFAFEESVSQICRNMKSIDINLERWIKKNLLMFHAAQPYSQGLENHLMTMHSLIEQFNPNVVIIDPITNLKSIGNKYEIKALFARLVDYLKMKKITVVSTSLLTKSYQDTESNDGVSSIMDAWILLQNAETHGEHNRTITILKSRGMKHSNQMQQILIEDKGITLKKGKYSEKK